MNVEDLSHLIADHLSKVAELFDSPEVVPGRNLRPERTRSPQESDLVGEIERARRLVAERVASLGRASEVKVKSGFPKPAWPHVYYLSFHDTRYTTSPTEGFYPVFLLSADHKRYWLSLLLAAASVGVSGRGGWSQERGVQLLDRAKFLGRNLSLLPGWTTGPIPLGHDSSYLHTTRGHTASAAKAYECGAIVSRAFPTNNVPSDLGDWLITCYRYFDRSIEGELQYLESSVPKQSDEEFEDQRNAAITGRLAELLFADWCKSPSNTWGPVVDRTDRVGLGFDFEFPSSGILVEVKGFQQELGPMRLTETEWRAAMHYGNRYLLCLVTHLSKPDQVRFDFVRDPHQALASYARPVRRMQLTYIVSGPKVLELVRRDQARDQNAAAHSLDGAS